MIRLVFAEDQTIVRRGIVGLLHTIGDIHVIAEAADGDEAYAAVAALKPDVALLDIRMPRRSGIDVLRQLHGEGAITPIILLTTFDEDPLFLDAVRAGAKGFLLKDVSIERLAAAIRIAAAGGTLLQPAVTERAVRVIQERGTTFDSAFQPDALTPREVDVLRLIAAGYSNREIGESLSMSAGSVKNHTSSILSKLGARDRTRAVLRGIELGCL